MSPNADDVLPPTDPPAPIVPPPPPPTPPVHEHANPTSVVCEFCQCKITTARGQVLDRSAKALAYLDTDLTLRELRRDLLATQKRAEELQEKVNAASAKNVAKVGL